MAPEQLSDRFGSISHRTDIFGIGGLLFHLLTGRPPRNADNEHWSLVSAEDPPLDPSRLQPTVANRLGDLCLQCLQSDPLQRPGSAAAIAAVLRAESV